jgi:hypothetical protein
MGKNCIDLLKGHKVKIMTDMKIEVVLEIDSITSIPHTRVIKPATRENDWWGEDQTWTTYKVTFTNGATKEYDSLTAIVVED